MISSGTFPGDSRTYLRGLYCILDEAWSSKGSLLEMLQQGAEAGVKLVQYRNKTGSMKQAFRVAENLRSLAKDRGIVFIVNDRCDLGLAVEADGVHLGQSDLPLHLARKMIPRHMVLGISTHNADQVRKATEEGADYLGFGPIFATTTKTNHDPIVGLEGLSQVRRLTSLPIFAIGGITLEAVPNLRKAGADGVAVASAILNAKDRSLAFSQFLHAFEVDA